MLIGPACAAVSPALSLRFLLVSALAVLTTVYACSWLVYAKGSRRIREPGQPFGAARGPTILDTAIGFVTNFFDTLGVGSFAPTTSIFKLAKLVPDERIPGTLNVGHTIPTITQAFIFITVVPVNITTLMLMIAASVAGAWFGAGIVATWPRRNVQIGMGMALLAAAAFFLMTDLSLFPSGGESLSLEGLRLWVGVGCNFLFGAFMTLGTGLYAPCMILVSLLGMNPKAAFPIMMGSCAFLMPVGSIRFIRKQSYSLRPALGLTLGGVPGVLIAAFIVKSLPLKTLRWLVVVVVVYTACAMLRSAGREKPCGFRKF